MKCTLCGKEMIITKEEGDREYKCECGVEVIEKDGFTILS